jgi:hypothetical protein
MLFSKISSKISSVSVMGIFVYMLEMSREANVVVGVIGVVDSWFMRSGVWEWGEVVYFLGK